MSKPTPERATAMDVDVSVPARALAEPARARMVSALAGGQALPAGELARVGRVAASTASEHLATLLQAGLLTVVRSGRHRYYRLSGEEVAVAVEALQAVAPTIAARSLRSSRQARDLASGRTCYDHLAGDIGMRAADILVRAGAVSGLAPGGVGELHPERAPAFLARALHLDSVAGRPARPMVRGCLDWTARRVHIGGRLGAHLLDVFGSQGWLADRRQPRAVRLTELGESSLSELEAIVGRAGPRA